MEKLERTEPFILVLELFVRFSPRNLWDGVLPCAARLADSTAAPAINAEPAAEALKCHGDEVRAAAEGGATRSGARRRRKQMRGSSCHLRARGAGEDSGDDRGAADCGGEDQRCYRAGRGSGIGWGSHDRSPGTVVVRLAFGARNTGAGRLSH